MTTQREPRRLELELQLDAQPIEGRLYEREGDGRPERAFSGWLGLIAAIEAAGATEARQTLEEKREAQ